MILSTFSNIINQKSGGDSIPFGIAQYVRGGIIFLYIPCCIHLFEDIDRALGEGLNLDDIPLDAATYIYDIDKEDSPACSTHFHQVQAVVRFCYICIASLFSSVLLRSIIAEVR